MKRIRRKVTDEEASMILSEATIGLVGYYLDDVNDVCQGCITDIAENDSKGEICYSYNGQVSEYMRSATIEEVVKALEENEYFLLEKPVI